MTRRKIIRAGDVADLLTGRGDTDPLKQALAEEFGRRRGWQLCSRWRDDWPDGLVDLLHKFGEGEGGRYIDHAYAYRTPNGFAIAAHLYNFEEYGLRKATTAYAEKCGIKVEHVKPDVFPSWHYPGHTSLVVWTKAEES